MAANPVYIRAQVKAAYEATQDYKAWYDAQPVPVQVDFDVDFLIAKLEREIDHLHNMREHHEGIQSQFSVGVCTGYEAGEDILKQLLPLAKAIKQKLPKALAR